MECIYYTLLLLLLKPKGTEDGDVSIVCLFQMDLSFEEVEDPTPSMTSNRRLHLEGIDCNKNEEGTTEL